MKIPKDYNVAIAEYEALEPEHKEAYLYAFPGYAVYISQSFEKLLMNIIWGHKVVYSKNETIEKFNAFFDKYEFGKYSMGALISDLQKRLNLPEQKLEKLRNILAKRNFFIHSYFIKNEILLSALNGYRIIIRDFLNYINSINEIEVDLEEYHYKLLEKAGYSKEKVQKEIDDEILKWESTIFDETYPTVPD